MRSSFPGDKRSVHHAHQKVAHRADPEVVVEAGNHNAFGVGLEPLRGWHPVEVLHFSVRSVAQLARKSEGGWVRNPDEPVVEHQARLDDALRTGRFQELFDDYAVSDEELEAGLADGTLAVDTRVRDALHALRDDDGAFRLPDGGPSLTFPAPVVAEAAAFAAEASVLLEIDAIPRAESRVAALEKRLAALRTLPRR